MGVPAKNFPRVAYVVFDSILMLVSFILLWTLRPATENWEWLSCHEIAGGGSSCFGISAVFRASFTLFIFHSILLIFLCPRAQCSSAIHDGFWLFKIIVVLLLFVGSFWIPHPFFVFWGYVCRIGSVLFLFVQAYFLLNLSYTLNDSLIEKTQDSNASKYAQFLLLSYSIVSLVICSVWIGFQFHWFAKPGCGLGWFTLILLCVFLVFFYVVALLKLCDVNVFRENATIFTVSIIAPYLTYLSWTSLASQPSEECNPFMLSVGNTIAQVLVGVLFTVITVTSIATAS